MSESSLWISTLVVSFVLAFLDLIDPTQASPNNNDPEINTLEYATIYNSFDTDLVLLKKPNY